MKNLLNNLIPYPVGSVKDIGIQYLVVDDLSFSVNVISTIRSSKAANTLGINPFIDAKDSFCYYHVMFDNITNGIVLSNVNILYLILIDYPRYANFIISYISEAFVIVANSSHNMSFNNLSSVNPD